ncbi:MAG TPA: hypothetical protein V6C57_15980 [Coleofasciculaceae cyanobacterium]
MDEGEKDLELNLQRLVEATTEAVVLANQRQNLEEALSLRDELNRLPQEWMTEVLNGIMLKLIQIDPVLCRWFILDVFLLDADPEGRADVAERINLLLADLRSV